MKCKRKKLLSVILIFSMVLSICIPSNWGITFASEKENTITSIAFRYDNVYYKIDMIYSVNENETNHATISLSIVDSNRQSEVCLPPASEIMDQLPSTLKDNYEIDSSILLSTESKTALSDVTTIKITSGDYTSIPAGLFSCNTSIKEITITSDKQITFDNSCFANMTALNNVTITANQIIMNGHVFEGCTSLEKTSLNSTMLTQLKNGSNFDGCSNLNQLDFNCPVNFYGSNDFSTSTFSKNETSYVNFQQQVKNLSSSVFSNINACDLTISLRGKSNDLSSNFIYNSNIQDLNILGSTHFGKDAIYDSNIDQFSIEATASFDSNAVNYTTSNTHVISNVYFNGKIKFSNASFCNATINNLTFLVENTKGTQNLTYDTRSSRLGYNTKVKNLYFDRVTSDGISNSCTELRDFPLGNSQTSSLNIDNIYFVNPNFKYIGGSDYKRCDNNGVTNVYGYGGALATDENDNYITSYDMYKSWTKNANCIYKNYVTNAETLDYTINTVVYLPEGKNTYTYNFNSVDNISAYASYMNNKTPFKDVNASIDENGHYPLKMTTDENASTNFNYRILQPNTSVDTLSSEKYVYTDITGKKYTTLTSTSLELTEGVHEFLLEVGGVKHSFKINVRTNEIASIESITPAQGNAIYLNIGEKLTKDMINVNVCYTNQTYAKLSDEEYEILNPEITDTENEVIIQLQISSTETIQKTITVYGYSQNATGFEVTCHQKTLPENSILSVSDVELHNVTFDNPNTIPVSVVTEGFHFVVDGEEVDQVSIARGTNKISVSYKNYIYKDAITITGTEAKVSKVVATYTGKGVYENCSVPTDTNNLIVYLYMDNNSNTPVLATDTSKITFDDYQIVANKENLISVYYNGVKAEEDIRVPGLKDSVGELTSAQYTGETTIGTALDAKNFSIEITLLSGKKLNSSTNPELLEHLTFSASNLTDSVNVVNVIYNGQYTKTITIFAYGSSTPPTTTTPSTGVPTNTPDISTNPTITKAPISTDDISISDTSVPLASDKTPSDASSPVPDTPTVPTATASATQTPTDIVSTVKKGNTYVVDNVKYKVLSIGKTSGTASIVGYVKSAKSVSVKTSVRIRSCTLSVVSIKKNAFKNCSVLKGSVKLNRSITTIGSNAFYGCQNITSVTIGSKLKKIGSKCFYNCKNLKKVDLTAASKLSSVGSAAFKKNAASRVFKIPSGTKKYFAKLLKGKY